MAAEEGGARPQAHTRGPTRRTHVPTDSRQTSLGGIRRRYESSAKECAGSEAISIPQGVRRDPWKSTGGHLGTVRVATSGLRLMEGTKAQKPTRPSTVRSLAVLNPPGKKRLRPDFCKKISCNRTRFDKRIIILHQLLPANPSYKGLLGN
ncbi:uncharacterized protein LOC143434970 isoform X4 [Arvicanthis niloticus]|uniref:uncharacterized protein LOC143309302 isoform X1 n=1 Tax=Arvicanthis niloticus TaxID=61156 RepID=UPI00402B36C0